MEGKKKSTQTNYKEIMQTVTKVEGRDERGLEHKNEF